MNNLANKLNTIRNLTARLEKHHKFDPDNESFYDKIISRMEEELARLNSTNYLHQKVLNTPVDQLERLNLSTRTINMLHDLKINKLGDILNYSRADILQLRNIGYMTVNELSNLFKSITIEWK
jgi:DNA-directed RNA polymerase alpha subunit